MEQRKRRSYPRQDLTGQTFGYLTPLYWKKGGIWHCKCQCGNEVDVDTRNLKSGHTSSCGCKRYETKNVKDMLGYENEGIKVLSRCGSDNEGVALWKCLCKRCGNTFITRGGSIRAGWVNSCGCVHSRNEQLITQMLTEHGIEFATQYSFPDLVGDSRVLRFDFAIFNNGVLSHLIEYQGEQHYKDAVGAWESSNFYTKKYDELKRTYCREHGIRLVEIPYDYEYTIDDLL